jgi:hypothetical protein
MSDETRPHQHRRALLVGGSVGCALAALAGTMASASAEEHSGHRGGAKGVPAMVLDGTREGICGTCRFWGGTRRMSEDRKVVHAESLGWCNNVDSPHFQSMRSPDSGPMKAWRKWEALA